MDNIDKFQKMIEEAKDFNRKLEEDELNKKKELDTLLNSKDESDLFKV